MAQKNNFENQVKELEKIIQVLEEDELSLDDALKNFEKGVKLYRSCQKYMEETKGKVSKLIDAMEVPLEEEDL